MLPQETISLSQETTITQEPESSHTANAVAETDTPLEPSVFQETDDEIWRWNTVFLNGMKDC